MWKQGRTNRSVHGQGSLLKMTYPYSCLSREAFKRYIQEGVSRTKQVNSFMQEGAFREVQTILPKSPYKVIQSHLFITLGSVVCICELYQYTLNIKKILLKWICSSMFCNAVWYVLCTTNIILVHSTFVWLHVLPLDPLYFPPSDLLHLAPLDPFSFPAWSIHAPTPNPLHVPPPINYKFPHQIPSTFLIRSTTSSPTWTTPSSSFDPLQVLSLIHSTFIPIIYFRFLFLIFLTFYFLKYASFLHPIHRTTPKSSILVPLR